MEAQGKHQLLTVCFLLLPHLGRLSHGCCSLTLGPVCGGSGERQEPQGSWVEVAGKGSRECKRMFQIDRIRGGVRELAVYQFQVRVQRLPTVGESERETHIDTSRSSLVNDN